MATELKHHFVAFLDILGFSKMVETDMRSDEQVFLPRLFRCHNSASQIFRDDLNCSVTQFSDSIVVATPFNRETFEWFATHVAEYQRLLLDEGLLLQGGIAVNKHFSNGSFTFSAGLIAAYHVESQSARYPRVVVSPDLLQLVFPDSKTPPSYLVQGDDGLMFIDYIGLSARRKRDSLKRTITEIVGRLLKNPSASVRGKGLWLASYSDAVLGTSLAPPRFLGSSIHDKTIPSRKK